MNKIRSGTQGVSAKDVRVGKIMSDHGSQIVTALNKAEVDVMDNRGHKQRRLPFSSIKIGEITLFKTGFAVIDSLIASFLTFFKK